ncbi:MAG: DUF3667 domain-containing protein [Cytophagales bacterium]|jgi:hypothetical protein|nr:DUF3667 domain-containing protein [Cytophagales bacterium]MCA6378758.1 DUF3667 domain-containing protein [Cytophagales bacterium]MCA6387801.1 DUF3667 domain-containing protein [Cytophagales bacterium]MCA6390538.1 DUF3667 domain-containing protein [Cytophagales bacterium]MCA6396145.1 DUF3667 domain-containing protein [Cytophagales bacterium]
MNQCINCQAETAGKFCANCGQRTSVKRITFREGWNDFWARIYGFDGMFPNTLRDLTIRPGKASRLFIDGNRVKYYGPVGYFFLMITLLYLVASLLDVSITEFMRSSSKAANFTPPKAGSGQEKVGEAILQFMSDNLKLVTFLFIPAQAFTSRYIFFRKSKLNYIEHTILPFYIQGHVYWLSVFSLILHKLTGTFLSVSISTVLSLVYFGYAYSDLFDYQSKIKSFFKGIGVYIVGYLLLMIIFSIGLIILLIVDPTVFETLRPSNNR